MGKNKISPLHYFWEYNPDEWNLNVKSKTLKVLEQYRRIYDFRIGKDFINQAQKGKYWQFDNIKWIIYVPIKTSE